MKKGWILSWVLVAVAGLAAADNTGAPMPATVTSSSAAPLSPTAKLGLKAKKKKSGSRDMPQTVTATARAESTTALVAPAKKQHWVCPMHDGGESDHPGKCPICGMDLELEP